jgi:hypothetical protein
MRKISYWARRHKWHARILIILAFVLLNYVGLQLGFLLHDMKIAVRGFSFFVILYFAGLVLYPFKFMRSWMSSSKYYVRQKLCDALLITSTFLMIVFIGNHSDETLFMQEAQATVVVPSDLPKDSTIKSYKTIAAFAASMKDKNGKTLKWKERKKLLKEQIRAVKKADDLSKGAKTALIILSVLVAALLEMLVLGLACNLSCSGSDAAAIFVGLGGTALVIFLTILVIRGITNKKKNKSSTAGKEKQLTERKAEP